MKKSYQNISLDAVQKELASRKLSYFIKHFWPYVDPATYIHGWHIDAICEHLQAVTDGQIKRLIINIPPRFQKSLSTCVFWPAWVWIKKPETQWLFASYAQTLSVRDSVKCRRLIASDLYQQYYGDKFRLTGDQNTKIRFENDHQGHRMSTSVGGALIGDGGDIIVIDDPHNTQTLLSKVKREAVLDWWDNAMPTRLNNPDTGAFVIIMQRLHENDLCGHILEHELGWDHLMLPARYESDHPFISHTSLGFIDKREDGELLWTDRFSDENLKAIERPLGEYGTAGQMQQRPVPKGGGMVKAEWFKRYKTRPEKFIRIVQSWDTATSSKQINDPSVCTTWGETEDNCYYLLDVFVKRMEYPELKRTVINLDLKYKPKNILIENKSSGISLTQDIKYVTIGGIIPITPVNDKETRMYAETGVIEAGRVFLPERAEWLHDYEQELLHFPNSTHDDQVDSTSQFLAWAGRKKKYRKRKQTSV